MVLDAEHLEEIELDVTEVRPVMTHRCLLPVFER
jgi:hypothetical protein